MTSRIWCFDRAIFRRDLRRTAPLWVIYTFTVILLLPVLVLGNIGYNADPSEQSRHILSTIYQSGEVFATVVAAAYGGLLAWALWFPLFQTKSAYFYAALPVRRESQFLTHYLSGLTAALVPNVVVCILTMIATCVVGHPHIAACLIWLAVATLGFVFFYSLATLCSMASGQMAAMPVLYMILNFVFVVVESIVRNLLHVFVYGLPYIGSDYFTKRLSPLYYLLVDNDGKFGCQNITREIDTGDYITHTIVGHEFTGIGYLAILAVVGVIFAALALQMFRKREMERCGDVICVSWLRPVFQYAFTLGCALVFTELVKAIVGGRSFNYNFTAIFLLLLLGALIGHVAARMLLSKSVRVFRKGWGGLLLCCAVLTIGFGAMRLDLFGYSSYIPPHSEVVEVSLSRSSVRELVYPVDDPQVIDQTLAVHQRFLDERKAIEADARREYLDNVTLAYRLSDGREVYRKYELPIIDDECAAPGSLLDQLNQVYNSTPCILARRMPETELTMDSMISCTIYHEIYEDAYEQKLLDEKMYIYGPEVVAIEAAPQPIDSLTLDREEAWALYSQCVYPDLLDTKLGHADFALSHEEHLLGQSCSIEFTYYGQQSGDSQPRVHYLSFTLTADAHRTIQALNALGYDFDF